MAFWRSYFLEARPREVPSAKGTRPVLIFVDASAEGDRHSQVAIGGVLLDPLTRAYQFFSAIVPPTVVETWRMEDQKQVIGQAELAAIPVALATWHAELVNRDAFVFVDNDAARDAAVKGGSGHPTSNRFAAASQTCVHRAMCGAWFERVPSSSNPADWPSRRQFQPLLKAGASRAVCRVPPEICDILTCIE